MLTIVEQPTAKEALDNARDRWQRVDDAWEAITWALSRDPTFGDPITESGKTRLAVFQGARSISMPTIEVIYETQEPYIIIHEATFSEAKAQRAGHA
mgnify:CR=1 FL=1